MTTKDLIKFLPFDEPDRNELLKTYEYADKNQRFAINQLVWTAYFDLYNDTLRDNLAKEVDEAKFGEGKLDRDLYKRALQKTEQEMKLEIEKAITDTDLSAARKAMEQIMAEIRAAKGAKKKSRPAS